MVAADATKEEANSALELLLQRFSFEERYGLIHTLELILGMINAMVFSVDIMTLAWDLIFFPTQNDQFGVPSYLIIAFPFVITYIKIWI